MISLRYTIVKGPKKWVVIKQVWTARGGTEWFLPAAKCRKINGGTIGVVVN